MEVRVRVYGAHLSQGGRVVVVQFLKSFFWYFSFFVPRWTCGGGVNSEKYPIW